MRKLVIAAMAFAAGLSLAWAQQGPTTPLAPGAGAPPPSGTASGGAGTAPVGHRQPRRADVPNLSAQEQAERSSEDRALDRKIKSICRGC